MFLDETVCISKASIRKYGATGAVILQLCYAEYGPIIPLEVSEWCSPGGILDFIQPEIVSRTLTGLISKGLIKDQGSQILLTEGTKRKTEEEASQTSIFGEVKKKSKRGTRQWSMAVKIQEVTKTTDTTTPNRYLKFAEILLQNYTEEDIEKWYGNNSWWYKNYWKGQQGMSPTQKDITDTVTMAKEGYVKPEYKKADVKSDFFR